MKSKKNKILIFVNYYLPGHKAGGPIRSISNLVYYLKDEFDFYIITQDRDFEDETPYENICINDWNEVKGAQVFYLSPDKRFKNIKKAIDSINYDVMYFNSFFSFCFTIYPLFLRKMNLIQATPIIIAPRGEFSEGAINIRKTKKKYFIKAAKLSSIYKNALWHSSSSYESNDIKREFKNDIEIHEAINLPSIPQLAKPKKSNKKSGEISMVYLSRVSPKKNLDGALKLLNQLEARINFDIYGPVDDKDYWKKCQNIITELPKNINARYLGSIKHNKVQQTLAKYDLFFFPTHGENYGHVIIEALMSGCPVLISDQTPWDQLESNNAGWALDLDNKMEFQNVIKKCINLSNSEINNLKKSAYDYSKKIIFNKKMIETNKQLFYKALSDK
ncbi:Glycosyl transferase, group 1 [Halanaerobium saccharolyticum subsp. saccharolyticum DSM 6643]|uniref:Glycosyl transferase, group 1 n=1 Tax=Halanaerobium saccharolyticum subsp. saccharolyticum DSM 6643 TaxID=1293054 RepID=M5E401_9FIRM|nr:glycosyltransferase family 4 protein [Halanaerobium saccharolyticum]CCU80941.1 Glycosyl transferase, group 1 [Halanaerobium saccharolyticum subsp. saccharolyticum DSM 6643]